MTNPDLLQVNLLKELYSRQRATESLYEFTRQAWPLIEGGRTFVSGWHIEAICEHLEAVQSGQIRNLLINIPPRCMKSSLTCVMFPAWAWISHPEKQFMTAAYAASLTQRDTVKCRQIISSTWYQLRWGDRFALLDDQNTKKKFVNDKSGYYIATSLKGTATGDGGDIIITDDPNNAKDGDSEITRESTNMWFSSTWSNRVNNRNDCAKIVVQQRLHERDVSGLIIANDPDNNWAKLILPMEFEKKRCAVTVPLAISQGKVWRDPRTKEGQLLWPEHIGPKALKEFKNELRSKGGEYAIAGQLQQRPSPEDGGVIKRSWFKLWKTPAPPKMLKVIQSWDTALEASKNSCYSACITLGVFADQNRLMNVILLNVWRGRLEFPDLRCMAKNLYEDYRHDGKPDFQVQHGHTPDMVLVEAKVSGISLIQEFRRAGVAAIRFDPSRYGDKDLRVSLITHLIEAGLVWVPARGPDYTELRPFADLLVSECASFPKGEYRDLVDTLSQALIYLKNNGNLRHPDEKKRSNAPIRPTEAFYGPDTQ